MNYAYFEVPTQVKFWDIYGDHYLGGIAYKDYIICGCCGGIFNINEIYEFSPDELKEDPIVVYGWVDINYDIAGGDVDHS